MGYWSQVKRQLIKRQVLCTPEICLLGLLNDEEWSRYVKIFLQKMLFQACKQIAMRCKLQLPLLKNGFMQLTILYHMKKNMYENWGTPQKYQKMYNKW